LLQWSNNLSEKSESDPDQEQDYEANDTYGLAREPWQDHSNELPRSAGNQVEKLINPVAFPPAPSQDMQPPLADQAKAQHLDDGTSRTDQKQCHPGYSSSRPNSISIFFICRLYHQMITRKSTNPPCAAM